MLTDSGLRRASGVTIDFSSFGTPQSSAGDPAAASQPVVCFADLKRLHDLKTY